MGGLEGNSFLGFEEFEVGAVAEAELIPKRFG